MEPTLDFDCSDCGPQRDNIPGACFSGSSKEYSSFRCLFGGLVDLVVNDTNRYAARKGRQFQLTTTLLFNFVAVLLLMGLNPLPETRLYWSNPCHTHTGEPAMYGVEMITEIMTYEEFSSVRRNIHWTSEDYEAGVSQVEEVLQTTFATMWRAYQHVVIDEGIVPFKGKVSWRQHIKSKPHSTGLKYFAAADETGFILDYYLFADFRSREEKCAGVPNPRSQVPQKVIDRFWKKICDRDKKNRVLVVDSYYGGIDLAESLHKEGSRFVMACQCNRPTELFGKKKGMHALLNQHEWDWRTNKKGDIVGVSFYNSSNINFLSNIKVFSFLSNSFSPCTLI